MNQGNVDLDPVTIVDGIVIEDDLLKLIETPDSIDRNSVDYSVLRCFDGQEQDDQWVYYDVDWHVVGMCEWKNAPIGKRAYVTLSREGDIEIEGAGGDPVIVEHIPDAGLHGDWSANFGYVNRVREIGRHLYVCGDQRQIYRRDDEGIWQHLDQGLLIPSAETLDELGNIKSDLMDIAGLSEDSIYAVGYEGEIFYFDGRTWTQIPSGVDEGLFKIKVLSEDIVYVIGANGTLLKGNHRDGFKNLSTVDDNQRFTGIEIFNDTIFLASNFGMFIYDDVMKKILPYKTNLTPDLVDCHVLGAKDGVMWSIGFKDLAYFDGRTWTRIHHPNNSPIGSVGPVNRP